MIRPRGPSRAGRWYTRLHRWLGIGSLAFVLLLSGTGIALNHSSGWSLDRRYVQAGWLLRWYGIDAPEPSSSFAVDGHSVALLGERLYFDETELAEGVARLVGAAAAPTHIAVATPSRVLLVDRAGRLVEQLPTAGLLPGEITAFGGSATGFAFRSGGRIYLSDYDVLDVGPLPPARSGEAIRWSQPRALATERLDRLRRLYRGRGLSVERLLLDLHSGRILSRAGPWIVDAVGAALIALSLLGLLLWLRRSPRRRPPA